MPQLLPQLLPSSYRRSPYVTTPVCLWRQFRKGIQTPTVHKHKLNSFTIGRAIYTLQTWYTTYMDKLRFWRNWLKSDKIDSINMLQNHREKTHWWRMRVHCQLPLTPVNGKTKQLHIPIRMNPKHIWSMVHAIKKNSFHPLNPFPK